MQAVVCYHIACYTISHKAEFELRIALLRQKRGETMVSHFQMCEEAYHIILSGETASNDTAGSLVNFCVTLN